jgi:hypothetical protein
MYSYKERIRAVKLYIKLGKRLRATIRSWVTQQRTHLLAGIESTNETAICRWAIHRTCLVNES